MTDTCETCGQTIKGKRSLEQNRLQHMWYREAAEQLKEYDAVDYRYICKLTLGIPILRGADYDFQQFYDRVIKPNSYEDKIALMEWVPVTSIMDKQQKKDFLDAQYIYLTGLGAQLTEPNGGGP